MCVQKLDGQSPWLTVTSCKSISPGINLAELLTLPYLEPFVFGLVLSVEQKALNSSGYIITTLLGLCLPKNVK